jgi:tetratricopeptide (TPR) repeat protein
MKRTLRFSGTLLLGISVLFFPDRAIGQIENVEEETILKSVASAIKEGKPKTALIHWGRIPETARPSATLSALCGLALLDCGEFEMARQKFDAAGTADPRCPEAKLGCGELEMSLLHWPEALSLLRQAQTTRVLPFRAAMALSQCFMELNQRREALGVLQLLAKSVHSLNAREGEGLKRRIKYLVALGKLGNADIYAMDNVAPKIQLSFTSHDGHIIIPVTLNGVQVKCHVDTGNNTGLAIDEKTAAALKIEAVAEERAAGVNFDSVLKIGLINDFQIGESTIRHVPVELVDSCFGGAAEAQIGLAILRRFNMSIDYKNKQFVIFRLPQSPNPPPIIATVSSEIPFRIKPLIIIRAKIDGGPEIPCILDTGAGIPVLDKDYYSESLKKEAISASLFKEKKGLPYLIKTLELGGLTFRNIFSVVLDLTPVYETGSIYFPAIIGASVLQNALIRLDFKTMRLTIEMRD